MWQVHHQKVDLAFNPTDDGKRLAEVSLSMSWWVRQRHKHLPLALLGGVNRFIFAMRWSTVCRPSAMLVVDYKKVTMPFPISLIFPQMRMIGRKIVVVMYQLVRVTRRP